MERDQPLSHEQCIELTAANMPIEDVGDIVTFMDEDPAMIRDWFNLYVRLLQQAGDRNAEQTARRMVSDAISSGYSNPVLGDLWSDVLGLGLPKKG